MIKKVNSAIKDYFLAIKILFSWCTIYFMIQSKSLRVGASPSQPGQGAGVLARAGYGCNQLSVLVDSALNSDADRKLYFISLKYCKSSAVYMYYQLCYLGFFSLENKIQKQGSIDLARLNGLLKRKSLQRVLSNEEI